MPLLFAFGINRFSHDVAHMKLPLVLFSLTGSFKTKETLKDEDIKLTTEIKDVEKHYKDIYRKVQELSETYAHCKDHFALSRYGDLKDMVKACVTEDTLRSVAEYSALRHSFKGQAEKGKAAGLLQAAKRFTAGTTDTATRDGKALRQ